MWAIRRGVPCRRLRAAGLTRAVGLGRGCAFRALPAEEHGMPGAGTDKTKNWIEEPGPVVVLVEPQLGENIGTAARAMANFGLAAAAARQARGRPGPTTRRGCGRRRRPHPGQRRAVRSVEAAVADCSFVFATTARAHDQAKPVVGPAEAAARDGAARRRRRDGRDRVRPRAQRARERRGRARRPHRHAAGQSGLCLAQSGAGGGDRGL